MAKTARQQLTTLLPFPLLESINQQNGNKPVAGFAFKGMQIFDPFLSECGRFLVSPEYYGLTVEEANALSALNQKVEDATQDAINAGCLAIQQHLGVTAGDRAGNFFSSESTTQIEQIFLNYALAEIADLQGKVSLDAK